MTRFPLLLAALLFAMHSLSFAQEATFSVPAKSSAIIFRVNSLNSLASGLLDNDPHLALSLATEAATLADKINFDEGKADAGVLICEIHSNQGEFNEALKTAQATLEIYNRMGFLESFTVQRSNLQQKARLFYIIGSVYCQQSNYSLALENFSKSFNICNEIADLKGKGDAYNGIGLVYRRKGDVISAMKNHLSALKIQEEISDSSGLASSFEHIGIVYIIQGNYPEATKNLTKALALQESLKDKRGIANALGTIGWYYGAQNQFTESLVYTLRAVKLCGEVGDKQNLAMYTNNIGYIYTHTGKYPEAMEYLMKAAELSKEIGEETTLTEIYESIGEVYSAMGNYASAITWLNRALDMAKALHSDRIIKECYLTLANTNAKAKNYTDAYKYRLLYSDILELIDAEGTRKIGELKSGFETDKKDKEILLLNKDKELLKQSRELQTAEISKQAIIRNVMLVGFFVAIGFAFIIVRSFNKSRKLIFDKQVSEVEMKVLRSQMNPHFIFNALYSINDYINHNKSLLASEYLIRFSKLMRLILENSRHKDVFLSSEVKVLELYMSLESQRMEHPFESSIEIDPEIDPGNSLIPPMLLQPIIENSIWHGLAPRERPGKICIRFTKHENEIQCEVEDNGVGRAQTKSLNKTATAESYGLKILAERLAIIDHQKKMKTNLTFHDLNSNDSSTGLRVAFRIPFELAL